jgi:hypothetical protein
MESIAFSRSTIVIGSIFLAVWVTTMLVGLVSIYVADEFMRPSFSEQSVPPPRLY